MVFRKGVIGFVFFFFCLSTPAFTSQIDYSVGQTGNAFLKIGASPQAVAMGEAYTALANDISSIYWNPAGLGKVKSLQTLLMHNQWFEGVLYEYGAFGIPVSYGALAGSVTYVHYGEMDKYDSVGQYQGEFSAFDLGLCLGYGTKLMKDIFIGANAKMPVSQLDGETTMSIAFDLGMLYDIPGVEGITLGLNVINLGTVSEDTSQPAGIKLGAGFRDIIKNMNMGIDIEKDFLSDGMAIDLGAEYVLFNKLRPRLGYQLESVNSGLGDSLQGLTAGLGVQTSLANMIMHVDYAYQPFGDIGDTHRIGILIEFGQISTPYKEEKE